MEEEFSCAERDGKYGTILRLLIWPSANYTSASIFETRERKCFWRSHRVHIVPSQETEMIMDMLGIVSSSEMLNEINPPPQREGLRAASGHRRWPPSDRLRLPSSGREQLKFVQLWKLCIVL